MLAFAVGSLAVLADLLAGNSVEAAGFIPAFDAASAAFLVVAAALGCLDAVLRRDSRSLPIVLLAGFGFVVWLAHLGTTMGTMPVRLQGRLPGGILTMITVTTPALLAAALLHSGRRLEAPLPAALWALLAGAGLGAIGLGLVLLLNMLAPVSTAFDSRADLGVGALGVAAAGVGLVLLVRGHRGDERIVSGVAAGLVLSAFANAELIFDAFSVSPIGFADHVLAALPFAALVAGQFSMYERSVRAERESEARLRSIFEASAMGICLIDARGRLIEANARAEELAGYPRAQLLGMRFTQLIHPDHPVMQSEVAALRRGERLEHRTDVCLRGGGGSERWVRLIVSRFPIRSPGGPYYVAMGHDVTEERLYQSALAVASERLASAERLRAGVDLTSDLVRTLDPAEIAGSLVRRVVGAVDADRCGLLRVEDDALVMEASFDRSGPNPWVGTRFPLDDMGDDTLIGQALASQKAAVGKGQHDQARTDGYAALVEGAEHSAVVPLRAGDELGGLLLLSRSGGQAFSEDDVEMLGLIGDVAALALRNARLFAGAKEASQAKSLFLNMAAHELRTPLTVILGYVSLLLEGSLGPPSLAWRPSLELLEGKTRELAALVDGILIAARLEEGPIGLALEPVDLRDVVADALIRLQPRARLTHAEVVSELPETPLVVAAHKESLDRIIDNLLNNALAYSASQPRVRLRASGIAGEAVVGVHDEGVGIAADMSERIFERLVRIDQPELGYPPGTGLGLYISRALAERMSGSLVLASSDPGTGSTFELRLPLLDNQERQGRPSRRKRGQDKARPAVKTG
jgi:PAS domain S-box-containing protein